MKRRQEYLAKFFGDLAKIIFGTVIIGQILTDEHSILRLITAIAFLLTFLGLSLAILPGGTDSE